MTTLRTPDPRSLLAHKTIPALPPRYPIEDLLYLVDPDIRKPFDMREVLLRIVDDSRLLQFKPRYGPSIITARAHILGECKLYYRPLVKKPLTMLAQDSQLA